MQTEMQMQIMIYMPLLLALITYFQMNYFLMYQKFCYTSLKSFQNIFLDMAKGSKKYLNPRLFCKGPSIQHVPKIFRKTNISYSLIRTRHTYVFLISYLFPLTLYIHLTQLFKIKLGSDATRSQVETQNKLSENVTHNIIVAACYNN